MDLNKIPVYINNKKYFVPENITILQACILAGIEIPHFCYHEQLSIAGNCRMCLVKVEGSAKPVASCALPVSNNMKITTHDEDVALIRENVMELLLVNHPLDCPICDQGGECDLQDQAVRYGNDRGRYYEEKRAVEDKDCGPYIKTIMNRCIHCTRCVRFSSEIAGLDSLGTTGRGNQTEIGTYIEKSIQTEISGNLIDICPVGALTSKPYTFKARPWELTKVNGVDIEDSLGSRIVIDVKDNEILRIIPEYSSKINEDWISDKVRFSYDNVKLQRLLRPHKKQTDDSGLNTYPWRSMKFLVNRFFNQTDFLLIHAIDKVGIGVMYILKKYLFKKGFSTIGIDTKDFRSLYVMSRDRLFDDVSYYLVDSVNIKQSIPVLNALLRKHLISLKAQSFFSGFYREVNTNSKHVTNGSVITSITSGIGYHSKLKNKESNIITSELSSLLVSKEMGKNILPLTTSMSSLVMYESGIWSYTHNPLISLYRKIKAISLFFNNLMSYFSKSLYNYTCMLYFGSHGSKECSFCEALVPIMHHYETSDHFTNIYGMNLSSREATHTNLPSKTNRDLICRILSVSDDSNYMDGIHNEKQSDYPLFQSKRQHNSTLQRINVKYYKPYNYYKSDSYSMNSKNMLKGSKSFCKGSIV